MNEKLKKLAEVIKDENLAKELLSKKDPADAQKWIKAHGIDMTLDEVKELGGVIKKLITEKSPEELEKIAKGEDAELTDSELADVAGGSLLASIGASILIVGGLIGATVGGSLIAVKVHEWIDGWDW